MTETRLYHIPRAGKPARLKTLAEAPALAAQGGFLWLDYCHPAREDLEPLIEALGLHPLSIRNCFDERQLPKIEDFPTNSFLILNTFTYADRILTVDEVDVFLGENFLVTVASPGPGGAPLWAGIEKDLDLRLNTIRQGPAFLLHVLLDYIVDAKVAAVEALEEELDAMEEPILADPARFNPADLLHLRRDLLALRKCLFHEREVFVRVCRKDCRFVPEKALVFYRDVYDHLVKFFEMTEASRDMVTSLMEMYLSMLNNQMTRLANQTNRAMRRLTLISTIFMPLTVLSGIFGMSEWTMMTGAENWRLAYPVFFAAMAVIAAVNYYLLKWLERRD